ncbi:ABC transporter permease [Yoonia sediminilitoris]|uniref:Phospholipid/cholesterol/gamma-HCH transport system permease protein n=1 Tax=Yoonia sediminilitoris TaxID=1286148 RepID=A0A2T6KIU4_9RHOB|nr:MlaE family lipid ABC transporter permease subunit [Yoonia sediminilitoris]PUB15639.1 phospholipid/cholesterol/gamma-HCH transport system permease protein [Yoonia sediminilitoris]RCW96248.1 phospholipid/cholesterol/gamma-HCH transport system permease protein [Yoonia sediminilitoris]
MNAHSPDRLQPARLTVVDQRIVLSGDLLIGTVEQLDLGQKGAQVIDLGQVGRIDTAGAWAIVTLERRLQQAGTAPEITGASQLQSDLIGTVRQNMPAKDDQTEKSITLNDRLEMVGRTTVASFQKMMAIIGFLGQTVATFLSLFAHPSRIRWTALVHHMQQVGLSAVPIVALMSFLIGVVLAFQGAAQLRQFGAEVFVVDLIAISVLRELGILLTAIIVAGRSGSAFTAAIGSMKMREEIDAMRTLGLNPIEVLVLPRVMALILMLPVLGVIANFSGLLGGALMSWIELGVSPGVFQSRLASNTSVWHLGVGLIKAPFFALIIGIVGCFEGMQVKGDVESLGRLTSTSVVLSIFLVIAADALFSIFFELVGV